MKKKEDLIKQYIREALISASSDYMRKERVRERLQAVVIDMIKSGDITDDDDLQEFFATIDMAAKALSSIPMMVWEKMVDRSG